MLEEEVPTSIQSNPYLIWQLIPGFITAWIGLYILSRPVKVRESKVFSLFMFAGSVWAFGSAVQLITPDPRWQSAWNLVIYLGILTIPTAWFLLSVKMTGIWLEHIARVEKWLWVVPVLTYLVVLTNGFHHLFFSSQEIQTVGGYTSIKSLFGPLFYVHTGYSYLLMFLGMVIVGGSVVMNFQRYGPRGYGLLIGVFAPLLVNVIYVFDRVPPGFPDPTPIAFTLTGMTFAWSIFGGRMLEIVPLAHDAIVQKLSAGIIVLDLNKTILNINPAAEAILGVACQAIQGVALPDLVQESPAVLKTVAAALDAPTDRQQDLQITVAERGETYEVLISCVSDHDGEPTGWLIQFNDISQRLKAEASLATTRQTFVSVLDSLADNYFEADPSGVITYANRAFANSLGFARDDVVGKNFRHFIHRRSIRSIFENFRRMYETQEPQKSKEYYYTRKDGEERVAEITVSPILEGTQVVGSRGIIRDITDRIAADRQIRLLGQVVRQMKEAVILTDSDPESRIRYVNDAFTNLYGYSSDEVLGKSSWMLYAGDDHSRGQIASERQEAVVNHGEYQVEYQDRRKDGSHFWVSTTSSQIHLGEGGVQYDLGIVRDITARVNAEKEVTEQRDLLDSLLQHAPLAVVINDMDSRIRVVNPAFETLFGYDRESIIGENLDDLLSTPEIVDEMVELTSRALSQQVYFEGQRKVKDGGLVDVELFGVPFSVGGEEYGTLAFYNDISQRLKTEADLARTQNTYYSTLDSLQDAYFEADPAGVITYVNLGFLKVTGYANKEEIVGKHFRHVISRKSLRTFYRKFNQLYQTQRPIDAFEMIYRTKDGVELTSEVVASPILDNGVAVGARGIVRDISVRVRAEQILREAKEAAERDLEIGSEIQAGFFPENLPDVPGWEIAAHFQAARQVAGDFYDIFQFRDSNLTAFIIADVCDKGVGAALFMVLIRSLLRAFSATGIDNGNVQERLKEIVLRTNNFIAEYHGQLNMFATVFFGILDPDRGTLTYINGGHEPPIMMDAKGDVIHRLMPTGPAVGMFPDMPFEVQQILVEPGAILVGYTDGVTDAKNNAGELFSKARLLDSIQAPWSSIFSMVFELYTGLRNHIGGQDQYDDVTLISFRRKLTPEVETHAICRVAKMDFLGELRDFVEAAAAQTGLSPENAFSFKLAAEEICANIIQHGYPDTDPGYIAMAFEVDTGMGTLTIWDDGESYPLDQSTSPDLDADWKDRKVGGLGVHLVRSLMDRVEKYTDEHNINVLVLEKALSSQGQAKE